MWKCQCSKDFPEEPFAMLSGKIVEKNGATETSRLTEKAGKYFVQVGIGKTLEKKDREREREREKERERERERQEKKEEKNDS